MSYFAYEAGYCRHCGVHLGTLEVYGGRHRRYCSNKCRQAAYRKRNEAVLQNGAPKEAVEKDIAQGLHLLRCGCPRSIWTVYGNVQIGGLRCGLCGGEFKMERGRR